MMHNNIAHNLLCREFVEVDYNPIYVADFTERTKNFPPRRSVEVSSIIEPSPDGTGNMDSVVIHNDNNLLTEFALLDDNKYIAVDGTEIRHCEGAMYISKIEKLKWIAFFEIKDCLSGNLKKYKVDVKEQIKNVAKDFKDRGFITDQMVFGIASFPRCKTAFNNMLFIDNQEATAYKKATGVTLYGTNEVFIMSQETLRPQI